MELLNGMNKMWHPVIDSKKCIGCMACLEFCTHGVYSEKNGKPVVINPGNCVSGCKSCEKICPADAITHTGKIEKKEKCSCKDCGKGCKC